MAHLAFVSPPFLGHLNPMRALARELVRRGHRATFVGMPETDTPTREPRLGFAAVGPAGRYAVVDRHMAATSGFSGIFAVLRDLAHTTAILTRDLPRVLRAIDADALVCDGTEAAGGLVAAHLGLPFVTVATALPLNREPDLPPVFTGWEYLPTAWGRERNRGGFRIADLMMHRHQSVIREAADLWGLGRLRRVDQCLSPLAQISQAVAGFDLPRRQAPAHFHPVGPIRDPESEGLEFLEAQAGPVAYISLGTLAGGRLELLRRSAEAALRAGYRPVVAHGGRLTAAEVATFPSGASVHAFVPQQAVLREARVAVLNGGLNTVLDALAAGTPVVVLPIAFEQRAIATRLARTGAGLAAGWVRHDPGRLATLVREVGEAPGFRTAAALMKSEIAEAGGTPRAADIVETLLRTGRPVARGAVDRRTSAEAEVSRVRDLVAACQAASRPL